MTPDDRRSYIRQFTPKWGYQWLWTSETVDILKIASPQERRAELMNLAQFLIRDAIAQTTGEGAIAPEPRE